ncbi:hypothetical protein [Methylobacterium sp. J-068]|uniref:hypothetical protein n=1 Tax=Methylobacterium sp. J-068 TaxID=2836649 RepID=UPI001FBBBE41|nr:hypothetical protein [Methylobacterium sp. J-068]MCJ2036711.1 hypothetical protein [Methylobacterium sp. J-068]
MFGLGSVAEAAGRNPVQPHAVMSPLERAATDCFAETVLSNPTATRHARAGHWYEAAGVTGFLCRPEVDAMIQAHDRLYGRGTGARYFQNAYTRHLGQELAARLQPMLERRAMASAEPPADKTDLPDEDKPAQ